MTVADNQRSDPSMPEQVAEYFVERGAMSRQENPVRHRLGVDSLADTEAMNPSELFASLLRTRDDNIRLRFHVETAEPRALAFMPELPRVKRMVLGEVIRDHAAFVVYSSGGYGPENPPDVVTLARSSSGWSVIPRGELFLDNDSFFMMGEKGDNTRPAPLSVEQLAWTARRFDQQLPVELFPSVLERFRGTPARLAELISIVPLRALTAKPGGKWSIQEHIGHLFDLEELGARRLADFQARAQVLTAADMSNRKTEDAKHNEAQIWTLQQSFTEAREQLVGNLAVLSADVIAHVAQHPRLQRPMNVVEWVYFMCEHDDHHLAKMRAQCIDLTGEIWDAVFGQ